MNTTFYRLITDGHPVDGMQPSGYTDPDTFTTDDKKETNHAFFQADDESILTGVCLVKKLVLFHDQSDLETTVVNDKIQIVFRRGHLHSSMSRSLK